MNGSNPEQSESFAEFLVQTGALRFGTFTTKSGRQTPFFINTGQFDTGLRLARLALFYASAIDRHFQDRFDLLFGPAYKGIPLAAATAASLALNFNRDCPFLFNRKEAKDHGEGGWVIGRKPAAGDRILLIDDVVTAGTSVRESIELLKAVAPVRIVGLIVSVDRQERGAGEKSALQELREQFGIEIVAIATLDEIVRTLHNRSVNGRVVLDDAMLAEIKAYRGKYGA